MAKVGKPPFDWTPEIEEEILVRIMRGEAVCKICGPGRDDWLPGDTVFYKRLASDPEFADRYARAREVQAETLAGQILDIADDSSADRTLDGAVNSENIQRSRLRVESRKWLAAKLLPKRYGDRQQVDHTSSDGTMSPKDADPAIVSALAAKLLD